MRTRKKHSLFAFGAAVATLALATAAQAQSLRPNMMFVFDTSISMRDNASGNSVARPSGSITIRR